MAAPGTSAYAGAPQPTPTSSAVAVAEQQLKGPPPPQHVAAAVQHAQQQVVVAQQAAAVQQMAAVTGAAAPHGAHTIPAAAFTYPANMVFTAPEAAALVEDQPTYVNPKQYARILKRRESRKKQTGTDVTSYTPRKRSYMHESRHKHAMQRRRGPGGRFLSKQERADLTAKEQADKNNANHNNNNSANNNPPTSTNDTTSGAAAPPASTSPAVASSAADKNTPATATATSAVPAPAATIAPAAASKDA